MSSKDFQKLNGLIAKLTTAAQKGIKTDISNKENRKKKSKFKQMPHIMNRLESGIHRVEIAE